MPDYLNITKINSIIKKNTEFEKYKNKRKL